MKKRRIARRIGMSLIVALLAVVLLAFAGAMWMTRLPGRSHAGALPPLTAPEAEIQNRVEGHLRALAGTIGERHVWRPEAMEATVQYIAETFRESGYAVSFQEFPVDTLTVRNVEVEIPGRERPEEILILGAHYDTVRGSPGADDNGSGVAALLELARLLASRPLDRTVRFVAFANEENPFFGTPAMGSLRYVERSLERKEILVGMISLESLGYYTDEPRSQRYPDPVGFLYPSTGNFVAFVAHVRSRPFVGRGIASFRRHTRFPSQGGALPGVISDIARSDHWPFWQRGVPAFMITDTAPFRNPQYHLAGDTAESVTSERLARVIAGLAQMTEDLAR